MMKIFFSTLGYFLFLSTILSQNVGINQNIPEHTLDVRSLNIIDAAGFNLSNLDKSKNIRFYSGSDLYPDPSITWAPSYSLLFASYNDTTFAFKEYMRIAANGKVGIGVNNPSAQLDINGGDWNLDAGNAGDFRIGNPTWNFRIGVATGGGGAGITRMYSNGNSLIMGTNNRPSLSIGKNENIGIGTIEAEGRLEINSSGLSDTLLMLKNAIANGNRDYGLYFNDINPISTVGAYFDVDSTAIIAKTDCITCSALYAYSSSVTGSTTGIKVEVNSSEGIGISANGPKYGVYGFSSAANSDGRGIRGRATGTTGQGVRGEATGSSGIGVYGEGQTGMSALTASTNGTAIYAYSSSVTGSTTGIVVDVNSPDGIGISAIGPLTGVYGFSSAANSDGRGVRGRATGTTGQGVRGEATGLIGVGVYGEGKTGVSGNSSLPTGTAVEAINTSPSGVARGIVSYSSSPSGEAILGSGNIGIYGSSPDSYANGKAVQGLASGQSGKAIYGEATGLYGKGIHVKVTSANSSANAILAESGGGASYAGYFVGNVHVAGVLSKSSGTFKIDHPLDPENKYLSHSFVESPDMMNIYNGNVITDKAGFATVKLPEYFQALNMDFRYQLTVIGEFAQAIIGEKIKGNSFKIRTDKPNIEVSWQVTGIRNDAFAKKNRVKVEEDKEAEFKGKYLNPEVFGVEQAGAISSNSNQINRGN